MNLYHSAVSVPRTLLTGVVPEGVCNEIVRVKCCYYKYRLVFLLFFTTMSVVKSVKVPVVEVAKLTIRSHRNPP